VDRPRGLEGKRRHLVAQRGELLDQLAGQQIAAGRRDLPDLDEGGAEPVAERHVGPGEGAQEPAAPVRAEAPGLAQQHGERDRAGPHELGQAHRDVKGVTCAAGHRPRRLAAEPGGQALLEASG
jgi:hypothetical protein